MDKIGKKVGDYIIIKLKGIFDQRRIYIVECTVCGNRREMQYAEFIRCKNKHCVKTCGENYIKQEVGKRYGDFIITGYTSDWKYKCKCVYCGKEKLLIYHDLHNNKRIDHKNCSNGDNDNTPEWKKFHSIWSGVRHRTTNPHNRAYKDYGDRGISSDDYIYFMDFKKDFYDQFLEAVKKFGLKEVSIDRINNDLSYTKDNIRFTDKKTQARNTRRIRNIVAKSPNGKIYHFRVIKDFAEKFNLCRSCITCCLHGKSKEHKGWVFKYE